MKYTSVLFFFLLALNASAQGDQRELQRKIDSLLLVSQELKQDNEKIRYELYVNEKEVEVMRDLMRGYIMKMDSLFTLTATLKNELDACQRSIVPDTIMEFPEQEAQFPGGNAALFKYVTENIEYPVIETVELSGLRVYTRFIVDKYGNIRDITIEREAIKQLSDSVIHLLEEMPDWIPAQHNGKPVASYVRFPVSFELF